jgi:hypothetical protein
MLVSSPSIGNRSTSVQLVGQIIERLRQGIRFAGLLALLRGPADRNQLGAFALQFSTEILDQRT